MPATLRQHLDLDEMVYGVSNSFRRGLTKTYSRRTRPPLDDDGPPRKIIRMDSQGFVQVTTNKRPAPVQDENVDPNAGSSSHHVSSKLSIEVQAPASHDAPSQPSTPIKESIFSDPCHPSSPLSATSPPPEDPYASQANTNSPPPKSHKPAFNLMKRKRSDTTIESHGEDGDTRASTPLTEITANEADARRPSGSTTATTVSTPSTAVGPASHPQKKQKFTQMTLDLGQDTRRTCKQCGMDYIPSSAEDAAVHKTFHNLNVLGVDMGKTFKSEAKEVAHPSSADGNESVVYVDRKMSVAVRKRVERVLETVVVQDLGALEIPSEKLWGSRTCPVSGKKFGKALAKAREKGEEEETREDFYRAFLYMEKDRCVGLCLAERINSAQKVVESDIQSAPKTATSAPRKGPAEDNKKHATGVQSSCVTTQREQSLVLMGVSRIWVSKSHRRKGIASTLLDCARRNFFYGIEVPKNMIAFSQPTQSGGSLARNWYGADAGWHVYESE